MVDIHKLQASKFNLSCFHHQNTQIHTKIDEKREERLKVVKGRLEFAPKELLMWRRLKNDLKHGTMPLNTVKTLILWACAAHLTTPW